MNSRFKPLFLALARIPDDMGPSHADPRRSKAYWPFTLKGAAEAICFSYFSFEDLPDYRCYFLVLHFRCTHADTRPPFRSPDQLHAVCRSNEIIQRYTVFITTLTRQCEALYGDDKPIKLDPFALRCIMGSIVICYRTDLNTDASPHYPPLEAAARELLSRLYACYQLLTARPDAVLTCADLPESLARQIAPGVASYLQKFEAWRIPDVEKQVEKLREHLTVSYKLINEHTAISLETYCQLRCSIQIVEQKFKSVSEKDYEAFKQQHPTPTAEPPEVDSPIKPKYNVGILDSRDIYNVCFQQLAALSPLQPVDLASFLAASRGDADFDRHRHIAEELNAWAQRLEEDFKDALPAPPRAATVACLRHIERSFLKIYTLRDPDCTKLMDDLCRKLGEDQAFPIEQYRRIHKELCALIHQSYCLSYANPVLFDKHMAGLEALGCVFFNFLFNAHPMA